MDTMLGTKVGMQQTFVDNARVPVTVISVAPNMVTQIINKQTGGHWAIQLGTGKKRLKNITKPVRGHLKAAYKDTKQAARFLREVRLAEKPEVKVGGTVKASDIFSVGDMLAITGKSKGKGFAGGVKRWGFAGGPKTHGQSDRLRAPGSIGQGTSPGRVWKGKKMAGRMGSDMVTIKNLKVVGIDAEKNEMLVSGPVPGVSKGLLVIKRISPKQRSESEDNGEN